MATTRVLLVDDDPGDALLVIEDLRDVIEHVHDVTHVLSIAAAASAAASAPFDVVLLDLTMPGTSGVATVERAADVLPDLPIVVLTGVDDRRVALEAVAAGAEDFLVKGRCDGPLIARALAYASERHRTRQQLEDLVAEKDEVNAQLLNLTRLQEEFVAIASHELRTPVTIASGFVDVVHDRHDQLSDAQRRDYLSRARVALTRLSALTEDLLTISRIGAGGALPIVETCDLGEVVAQGLSTSAVEPDDVTLDVPPGILVDADRSQLARVVRNLLDNGQRHGRPPFVVRATVEANLATLRIEDHGDGVPEAFVGRLFERFAQADRVASRAQGGTGLGLAIVRGLLEAINGTVRYEPASHGGAAFVVAVPLHPAPTQPTTIIARDDDTVAR